MTENMVGQGPKSLMKETSEIAKEEHLCMVSALPAATTNKIKALDIRWQYTKLSNNGNHMVNLTYITFHVIRIPLLCDKHTFLTL